jgi:hypothetical protein
MNNVCSSVYVSALFFVPDRTDFFARLRSVVVLRSERVEEKKVIEVRVQSAEEFKKRSDFRKRYFSSRGDHASETLTKRRSQIISVKKNRDILLSSHNHLK